MKASFFPGTSLLESLVRDIGIYCCIAASPHLDTNFDVLVCINQLIILITV